MFKIMFISDKWIDYQLIDAFKGKKLERFGKNIFIRPDPNAILDEALFPEMWQNIDAEYHRSKKGGGCWNFNKNIAPYIISYGDLKMQIKPMNFKHVGIFPEQAANWDWIRGKIEKSQRKIKVLNLFAYTGMATVAALKSGASVCHVDSSKGIISMAKENVAINGLKNSEVRYIADDCLKFVSRETRRGNFYDAIILDPPSYGRGTNGEVWNIEENLCEILRKCKEILSDKAVFVLLNTYSTGLSPQNLTNIMKFIIGEKSYSQEIGLRVNNTEIILPCGVSSRCEF